MDTHTKQTWWESYRETMKISRRFRELVSLVGDREDVARNLLDSVRKEYPNKSEIWYLEKLITKIKAKNTISFA